MKKIIFMLMFFVGIVLNANVIEQNGEKNGYDLKLYTKTTPISGNNDFYVTLEKSGKVISNAKMKIKVFMPEMPGMPYMEYETKAKFDSEKFVAEVNFSMGGTWQYHIKFRTDDKKVHTLRGSVNL